MRFGEHFFRVLLLLYPRGFRRRYRQDLIAFLDADLRRARTQAGTTPTFRFWFRTVADLFKSVVSQWAELLTAGIFRRVGHGSRPMRHQRATLMEMMIQDLKFAIRAFRRNPGFTLIAVATLALGIGTNAAMFSVVNGILLEKLPYASVERIVAISGSATDGGFGVSENERLRYREQAAIFDAFGTYQFTSANIAGTDGAERLMAAAIDEEILPALGVTPILGRGFVAEETEPSADRVILLSHTLWSQRFEMSPRVLGQSLVVNGIQRTIVGVMPEHFHLPGDFVGTPVQVYVADLFGQPDPRNLHYLQSVARLANGVSLEQAEAQMAQVGARLLEELPTLPSSFVPATVPVEDVVIGEIRPLLLILLGAVALLLVIACANVANLFLARSDARAMELAMRAALGASRGRLIRQILSESVVLAVAGGAIGLMLAYGATEFLVRFDPPNIPRIDQLELDLRVVGFTMLISLITAFAFGLIPALTSAGPRIQSDLREGGRGSTGSPGKNRFRRGLVVVEVALALTLTTGAGLLVRSFARLVGTDTGLDPNGVITLQTTLPSSRYGDATAARTFYGELLTQIRSLPGVYEAGGVTALPLASDPGDWGIRIEGREEEILAGGRRPWADRIVVTNGYFEAMGILLVEGRTFNAQDMVGGREVVVINQTAAERYWPNESALGKRFMLSTNIDSVYREVVGITQNVKHGGLSVASKPEMFLPHAQHPATQQFPIGTLTLAIRTSGDPTALVGSVRQAVRDLDGDVPVSNVRSMVDLVSASTSTEQLNVSLFATFGVLALLLVSVGVYGVMSYLISQRRKELGIRMALGATPRSVLGMIIKHGMMLATAGAVIGLIGALGLGRLLSNLLYGITWYDPLTFVGAPILVTIVALFACTQPARNAIRVDPIKVLRSE